VSPCVKVPGSSRVPAPPWVGSRSPDGWDQAQLYLTDSGWLLFSWLQCRQLTASTQSNCGWGVDARLHLPGARSGLPCHVPACCCHCLLARAGSGSHSGVELCRSRTGEGSSGGEEEGGGVRSGRGEARTILLLHIISVRPSKQSLMVRTFLKVYMELGSYFLFLQEQIKVIIIIPQWSPSHYDHFLPRAWRVFASSFYTGPL
jgi:hypothetical protein